MNDPLINATPRQQSRAYAAWYGVQVGLCWILSFGLTMWSLREPLAGNFALLIGLGSIPLGVWLLRDFRTRVADLSARRAWHMSWMMFLCAALLTTAAQYVYFAYLDGGMLARAYGEMLNNPVYQPMLEKLLPGQDLNTLANEFTVMIGNTTPAQMAMQLSVWNVLIATVFAIPTAFLAIAKKNGSSK